MENTTSLSGYLSVLLMFCVELFKAPPKSIVFGGEKLIPLEMVNGLQNNTYCAFSAWDVLFKDTEFLRQLIELNTKNITDLQIPLSKFMAEKLSIIFQKDLQNWQLEMLISIYQNLQGTIEILKQTPTNK